jgi:hypothetical protein
MGEPRSLDDERKPGASELKNALLPGGSDGIVNAWHAVAFEEE